MLGKEKRSEYFVSFAKMADCACREASLVLKVLNDYHPEHFEDIVHAAHEIENEADMINHEIFKKVASDFVTPIDREDISLLARRLDNIVDSIEEVVLALYMYNISEVPSDAVNMMEIVERSCEELVHVVTEFPNFKHSNSVHDHIVKVNTLEEEADRVYMHAVRKLYIDRRDPLAALAWEKLYIALENCCDACETVADLTQTVIAKNS